MSAEIRGEQRQAVVAVLVSLIACMAVSASTTNLISDVSSVAGTLTFAASFYAMLLFVLHLRGVEFVRPATVRRWQALIVLCVTALSAWVLLLSHTKPFIRTAMAFTPCCVLLALILGPWHGLMPVSKSKRDGTF
jgi:peptidoglycan/LPS O-acetylase OafA/YrhL